MAVQTEAKEPMALIVKGRVPEKIVAWACGTCGIVARDEQRARECCDARCAGGCGARVEIGNRRCDRYRRTGRTTRMLLQAVLAASEKTGAQVVVVAHHLAFAKELFRRCYDIVRAASGGWSTRTESHITLANGSTIEFQTIEAGDFASESWRMGRDRLTVFYDHFARYMAYVVPAEKRVREFARELGVEHLLHDDADMKRLGCARCRFVSDRGVCAVVERDGIVATGGRECPYWEAPRAP